MDRRGEEVEVFPALWFTALQLQRLLRRGDNLLRLHLTPKDGALRYRSQFRWVVSEDQTPTSTTARGSVLSTNHGAEGEDDREARGPVTLQRALQAPFTTVQPWLGAPAISTLTAADRAAILELIRHLASQPSRR